MKGLYVLQQWAFNYALTYRAQRNINANSSALNCKENKVVVMMMFEKFLI